MPEKKQLNGLICIDKPKDFTSFDVVAKMRGITKTKKIGHAGTLDPMATGVLPLFLGRATKACDLLPNQDKRYEAEFVLGFTTDTQDITGTILERFNVTANASQVEQMANTFVGTIKQIPPMYSAVKIDGKKLYTLARKGIELARPAREITIYDLTFRVISEQQHRYLLDVTCSKGTYIRTLVSDIGKSLKTGATLTALRRTMAAGFAISECYTLEKIQTLADSQMLSTAILPVYTAFQTLPKLILTHEQTKLFLNGVKLDSTRLPITTNHSDMAVFSPGGIFLGTAYLEEGTTSLRLRRLFCLEVPNEDLEQS